MKRILSLFIAVVLLVSVSTVLAIETQADDSSTEMSEAVEFMQALGVVDITDSTVLYNPITREDFALYTAKLLNVDVYQIPDKRYFSDLSMTSYGTFSVNALVDMNVISRGEDGKFRPDDNITLEEAAKILCTITGYGPYAEANGGFPTGYLKTANRNKILTEVSDKTAITLSEALDMLYEAIQLNVYDIETITLPDKAVKYTADSGRTILSIYHSIYFAEGLITGVYGRSIYEGSLPEKGEMYINNEKYLANENLNKDENLGEYVKYFYRYAKGDSVSDLVYVTKEVKKDNINILINDALEISDTSVTYYKDSALGKKETVKLASPVIVYNGYPVSKGLEEIFNNLSKGYITLKDSDTDGNYDLMIIEDYTTTIVNYADAKNHAVYDKLDLENNIVCDEYSSAKFYNESLAEIPFSDIAQGDVLSVAKSKNKETVKVIRTRNVFNGTMKSISGTTDIKIVAADDEYKVDKNYADEFKAQTVIGGKYYYYLDYMDEIVYVTNDVTSKMSYGYMTHAKCSDVPFSAELLAKMITTNAKIEEFVFADNVRIDGVRYKEDAGKAFEALAAGNSGVFKEMLVRYTLNADGKINEVDTPYLNRPYETEYNSLTSVYGDEFTSQYARGTRLGLKAYVDTNTVAINMPEASVFGEIKDNEIYVTKGVGNDASYTCKVYTENINNEYVNVIANHYSYSKIANNNLNTKLFMVDGIEETLNEDGNIVPRLKGYLNGTYTEYVLYEEIEIGDIEQGDLVKLHFDYYGNPIPSYAASEGDIVVVYDYSLWKGKRPDDSTGVWKNIVDGGRCYLDVGATVGSAINYYARLQLSFGYAHKRRGDMIEIGYNSGADFDEIFKTTSVKTVVYDKSAPKEEQRVYVGNINDILDYESVGSSCSTCLIQTRDMDPMCLIIYK